MGCCCDEDETIGALGTTSVPECDLPATLVWPSTVDSLRARVDTDMRATDGAVTLCKGLPEADRAWWRGFYSTWRLLADEPTGLFGLGAKWDMMCGMSRELSAFKDKIRDRCEVAGPANVERPKGFDLNDVVGALKWVAIAGVAIAGVYAVKTVWPR